MSKFRPIYFILIEGETGLVMAKEMIQASEIIIICWFAGQETFLIIITVAVVLFSARNLLCIFSFLECIFDQLK